MMLTLGKLIGKMADNFELLRIASKICADCAFHETRTLRISFDILSIRTHDVEWDSGLLEVGRGERYVEQSRSTFIHEVSCFHTVTNFAFFSKRWGRQSTWRFNVLVPYRRASRVFRRPPYNDPPHPLLHALICRRLDPPPASATAAPCQAAALTSNRTAPPRRLVLPPLWSPNDVVNPLPPSPIHHFDPPWSWPTANLGLTPLPPWRRQRIIQLNSNRSQTNLR